MKHIPFMLFILSIILLTSLPSVSLAECHCPVNSCIDPEDPDPAMRLSITADDSLVCVGTEVTFSLSAYDCDCIWEIPHAPECCDDELTFDGWPGDIEGDEGGYTGEYKVTKDEPTELEIEVTPHDAGCGYNDPDIPESVTVTWVAIDELTGPETACTGHWAYFEATTDPPGHEDMLTWSFTGPGEEYFWQPYGVRIIRWPVPGVYKVTVTCGASTEELTVEVVDYPCECEDSDCSMSPGSGPGGCTSCVGGGFYNPPDLRSPWTIVRPFVPDELGGPGWGDTDAGRGGCPDESVDVFFCDYENPGDIVYYRNSCGKCYSADFYYSYGDYPRGMPLGDGLTLWRLSDAPLSAYMVTDWSGRTTDFQSPVDDARYARRRCYPISITEPDGSEITFSRDSEGGLNSVTYERTGETWTYGHATGDSKVTSITAPDGRRVEIDYVSRTPFNLAFDKPDQVRVIVDSEVISQTDYDYDTEGRIESITKDGLAVVYSYTATTVTLTDQSTSTVTEYDYAVQGHPELTVVTQEHPTDPKVWTYEFYMTDPLPPALPVKAYLKSVTNPLSETTTYEVDSEGKVTKVTDALGRITNYHYEGDLLESIGYLDDTYFERYTYYADSPYIKTVENVRGNWTLYERDTTTPALWKLEKVKVGPGPNEPTWVSITETRGYEYYGIGDQYGRDGLLKKEYVTDIEGTSDQVTEYEYWDSVEEKLYSSPIETKYSYPDGQGGYYTGSDKTAYDDMGNVTSTTDANNRTISHSETYEEENGVPVRRIETTTYATGRYTQSAYSICCGLLLWTRDEEGRKTYYAYDDANRVTKVWTDLSGQSQTYPLVEYTYDEFGNVEKVKTRSASATIRETVYEYDDVNRVTRIEHPSPLGPEEFAYDDVGNLIGKRYQKADESWVATAYEYDDLNRLVKVDYSHGSWPPGTITTADVTYEYDGGSRLRTSMIDPHSTRETTFAYDEFDRLEFYTPATPRTEDDPDTDVRTLHYVYNNLNQKTQMELYLDYDPEDPPPPEHTVDYAYFKNGWLKNVQWDSSTIAEYAYDAAGNRTDEDYANGTFTVYDYDDYYTDPRYWVNKIFHKYDRQNPETLLEIDYPDRDGSGNPEQMVIGSDQTDYTYDENSRLDSVTYPGPTQVTFGYDWVGNRKNPPADPNGLVFNAADQLTSWPSTHTYDYYATGSLYHQYDSTGQTVQKIYEYTEANLLSTVVHGDDPETDPVSETEWDADENRVSFTSSEGGTWEFVYDPTVSIPAVFEENDGTGSVYYIREPNGSLIARIEGESIGYYHFDELGSTRLLTDADGDVTDGYTYDAWGQLTNRTEYAGSVDQPYQFVGQLGYYSPYQDANLFHEEGWQLLGLGVRLYDPEIGRFTQRDKVYVDSAGYLYARNSPTIMVDPSGLKEAPVTGEGSCYGAVWTNCCTACGECFNQNKATAAALGEGKKAGWKCGDKIECCRASNPKNCVTVTINDTGSKEDRLIDFGCAFVIGKGFFPGVTVRKVSCKKVGHTAIAKKCELHSDCGKPCERGVKCEGQIK